jgi:hypothetical protein
MPIRSTLLKVLDIRRHNDLDFRSDRDGHIGETDRKSKAQGDRMQDRPEKFPLGSH